MTALLLAALLAGDTTRNFNVAVTEAESLQVTDSGVGEAVVLVPGLFGSAYGYRKLVTLLTDQGYRAIVIDPLGMGLSTRPARSNYSLTSQADRLAAALDTIGVSHALVVAHSIGAAMVLRLAYRRPDLVRALVSIEGGPAEAATTKKFRSDTRYIPWIKLFGGIRRIRKTMHRMLRDASGDTTWVTDEVVLGYTAGTARDVDGTLLAYLGMAAAREPEKVKPHLSGIHCPVLLLLGEARHAGAPPEAEVALLQGLVSSASVNRVAGAGHYIHEERPDAVLAAIEQVRRTLAARAP